MNSAQSGKSLGCPLPWQPTLLQWGCCHGDLKSTLASVYLHCVALIRARQEGKESAQLNRQKKTQKQILCPANGVKLNLIHAVMSWEYWRRVCVWGSNWISTHWFGMRACGGMLLKGESTASVNDMLTARFGAVYILCGRSEVSSSAGLLNNDRVIAVFSKPVLWLEASLKHLHWSDAL